ncbi:alcohol dehydrogenase 2-like [Sabethes cyaneus]|uniref:alcohol dehydrogenase 2-like n=1 Tax=Sabethes cyaneus TaxID=53552 RepID=UPI00237DCD4D|nr:alcohol dehydrogenase 2-like [Sabethes cyaneus]
MSGFVLRYKAAVITGAAKGIGFATAKELLKNGVSKVLLLDIQPGLTLMQCAQLKACNSEADVFYVQCDVSDKQQLDTALRRDALNLLGSFDILVNSAGVWESCPTKSIDVNLIGSMHCTLLAIDLMDRQKSGTGGFIVNVSDPEAAVYTEKTFGVIGFTRTLGTELLYHKKGIKLAVISPCGARTNILKAFGGSSRPHRRMKELFEELMVKFADRQPRAIGKSIVKVITEKETGSVWLSAPDTENDAGYWIAEVKFELNKNV